MSQTGVTISRSGKEILLLLGALVAFSFLADVLFIDAAFPYGPAWKVAGIVLLGCYALGRGAGVVAAALFFSAAGDVALDLEPPAMVAGMGFFGLAHLLYIAAFAVFIRQGGLSRDGAMVAALVAVVSVAMLFWFWPEMGALRLPGLFYQAIITAMVALAVLSPAPLIAKAGAAVFMLSDTLIALTLYRDIPVVPGAVWITYVAAQVMLAKGLARPRYAVTEL